MPQCSNRTGIFNIMFLLPDFRRHNDVRRRP